MAAEAQKDSPAEVNLQQHNSLENGEISQLDHAHKYYHWAIQVATKFATFAENFAPCLRPLTNYSNQLINQSIKQSINQDSCMPIATQP